MLVGNFIQLNYQYLVKNVRKQISNIKALTFYNKAYPIMPNSLKNQHEQIGTKKIQFLAFFFLIQNNKNKLIW